jgi:hypothetical protein
VPQVIHYDKDIFAIAATLSPEQEDLCRRLDGLHEANGLRSRPSVMFRGAMVAASPHMQRANPDWLAQAAHSMRDILYPIYSPKASNGVKVKKKEAFKKAGGVRVDEAIDDISAVYGELQDLTHHVHPANDGTGSVAFGAAEFRDLMDRFVRATSRVLSRQLDIHAEIDGVVSGWPDEAAVDNRRI